MENSGLKTTGSPCGTLKGETPRSFTADAPRNGRQLKEIAAQDELEATEGPCLASYGSTDDIQFLKEIGCHHADFVNDENIRLPPSTFGKEVPLNGRHEDMSGFLCYPYTCPRVKRLGVVA